MTWIPMQGVWEAKYKELGNIYMPQAPRSTVQDIKKAIVGEAGICAETD